MKELKKLRTCLVKTGNSMLPLMMNANQLGIEGWVVLEIKIIKGGDEQGDIMEVEIWGVKE